MGLNEITIDFTKCRSGIIRIIGDNGSGKSTLVNALTPLPDDNSAFIPFVKASKQVVLFDEISGESYVINFIHNVNDRGERTTTQGYITKIYPDGTSKELNPTGKISTCKELIYSELELDSNFITLTKMSTTNKGLAGMTPSERKKYVNAIVSETQAFTDIYKKFLKKSNFYKDTIKRISSKIDSIGNLESLTVSMEQTTALVTKTESVIQKLTDEIATQKAILSTIPDEVGFTTLNARKNELENKLKAYSDMKNETEENIRNKIECAKNQSSLYTKKQSANNMISENLFAIHQKDSIALQEKTAKLAYMDVEDIDKVMRDYQQCASNISKYKTQLEKLGIDTQSKISKDDYINAIDALSRIRDIIKDSCNDISTEDIPDILLYRNNSLTLKEEIATLKNKLENELMSKEINERNTQIYNELKSVETKMKTCSMSNDCPALSYLTNRLENTNTTDYSDTSIESIKRTIERNERILTSIDSINIIVTLVKSCKSILSAIGLGELIASEESFILDICNHKAYVYIDKVMNIAVDSNLLDLYRYDLEKMDSLKAVIDDYNTKEEFLNEVKSDIEFLSKSIDETVERITQLNKESENYTQMIKEKDNEISSLQIRLDRFKEYHELCISLTLVEEDIERNLESIKKIQECQLIIKEDESKLSTAKSYLEQQKTQQNEIAFNIKLLNQYLKEMEEVKLNYDKIERIKKYTNPSQGGIQNLFVAMHMNKIIVEANQILGTLFNGSLMLQTFIINESEFRIPVSVEGGIPHDDINSLSAGQTALISMIITAALSKQASTKLNVFCSDELDGPLDPKNRRFFLDTLKTVRTLTGSTQSIMISHNVEVSNDECDIILLKNDNSDGPNVSANIIWSWYNN